MSEEALLFAEFGISCALAILIARVLKNLTLWEFTVGELLPDRDHWWVGLSERYLALSFPVTNESEMTIVLFPFDNLMTTK